MSDDDSPLEPVIGVVAVATLPIGILAAIFLGGNAAAVVFVVGWLLLVPVLGVLDEYVDFGTETTTDESSDSTDGESDDALQRLRERYAAGEIDEAEFERRVEALIETEDVENPAETARASEKRERRVERADGTAETADGTAETADQGAERVDRGAETADREREREL